MAVLFSCGQCGALLEAEERAIGMAKECPACHTAIKVPHPTPGGDAVAPRILRLATADSLPESRTEPGMLIAGFRIKQFIARGGMGEVYLAEQLSAARDVALKILPPQFHPTPETVASFLEEVRVASRLHHPNLVSAFEAGEDRGIYYLAMPFIDGETVHARLHREGPMSEAVALAITEELATALAWAWDTHRLIHCDIKPGNIMLNRDGKPYLMDMGLSKLMTDSTVEVRETHGTPNYVSPEQAAGTMQLDIRTDMFSLGMTLYHMLSGQVPFDAPTVEETLQQLHTGTLPDPRIFNPTVSENCVMLLRAILAREPSERYWDWNSLVSDVARVRAGEAPERSMTTNSVLGA